MHRTQRTAIAALVLAFACACGGQNADPTPGPSGAGVPAQGSGAGGNEARAGSTAAGGSGGAGGRTGLGGSAAGRSGSSGSTALPDAGVVRTDAGTGGTLPDASVAPDGAVPDERWVTTWGTTLIDLGLFATTWFDDATFRQIVHTSAAGARVRVRFSNAFGASPLEIAAAHIALHDAGASIVASSDRPLTFAGAGSVTIPAGEQRVSDPIAFDVPALTNLAITVDLPGQALAQTVHSTAIQNAYASDAGGLAGAATLTADETLISWAFLEAVDVQPARETAAIVAFGDSITDGWMGTNDTNQRWPDELARRIDGAGLPFAVVNEAFSGNQVLAAGAGEAALSRFDRDVFSNAGVTHVIVLEGVNDIGLSGATADAIIDGYEQLIQKARAKGVKIIFGTICPFEGAPYYSEAGETARIAVNEWIRTSDEFDGFIDFDAAVRDPAAPKRLLSAYDSGDFLHPSDAGYRAMGQAVDLALFE